MKKENRSMGMVYCMLAACIVLASSTAYADRSDVEAFVTRFYHECLERDPDAEGLESWVNSLLDGSRGGADIAYGFMFHQESLNKNRTNEEFMFVLYRALFNREPDPMGYFIWLNRLYNLQIQGVSVARAIILDEFVHSREFINLCSEYGVNPYATVAVPTPPETPSDGDIALENLVGAYELVSFTTTYDDGSVITGNDVNSFSGILIIGNDGTISKIIEIDGAVEIITGIILEVGNNYLRITIIDCTYDLIIGFSDNTFVQISPMGSCGTDYQQLEVWEKISTTT